MPGTAPWWNDNYLYRKNLTITAPAGEAIPVGYTATTAENTTTLQAAGKVRSDRKDWRVVYWDGAANTELDRVYVSATETHFKIQAAVDAAAATYAYYLYYGYATESTTPPADYNDVYWWGDQFETGSVSTWALDPADGLAASTTTPIAGAYSLYLAAANTGSKLASITFADLASYATLRFKAKRGWVENTMRVTLRHGTSDVDYVQLTSGLAINYSANGTMVNDTTYAIMMKVRTVSDWVCRAYQDGVEKTWRYGNSATHVDGLKIWTNNPSGFAHWIDDISVAKGMATDPTVASGDEVFPVSDTQAVVYDMVGVAFDSQVLAYNILQAVSDTQAMAYHMNQIASDTQAAAYNILNYCANDTQAISWWINSCGFTQAICYNVIQRVKDTQTIKWDMGGVAHSTKNLRWQLVYLPFRIRPVILGYTTFDIRTLKRKTSFSIQVREGDQDIGRTGMLEINMVEGDSGPTLTFTVKQNGVAIDLSGAGVVATFTMRPVGSATVKYTTECTNLESDGTLKVPFTSAALDTSGEYTARIKITGLSGGTQSTETILIVVAEA
jgi:hypothetical protein